MGSIYFNGNDFIISYKTVNVYSDSKATKKIGETTATDAKGVATYKEIPKIGTYYLQVSATETNL